jgi:hypothetical protein
MIIISFGVRKSGSTLAFQMARAVLELGGHPQVPLPDDLVKLGKPFNAIDRWNDDRLDRLVDAAQGTRLAIKTHGAPDQLSTGRLCDHLDAGEVRIHVVFRDPRDTVLSMLDEARAKPLKDKPRTVEEAISRLRAKLGKLRRWGAFSSLKLLYGDFAFDPAFGPELIGRDLGVAADPQAVWSIVNRSKTRKRVARPERYRAEMSEEDAARVAAAFPEYLRLVEDGDLGWFERTQIPVR